MQLSFAALHALFVPYLAYFDELPPRQGNALGSAFGLVDGAPADPFLVALSALTLLDRISQQRPVCCIVEDAQWIDRESLAALAFVARRLGADPIGLFFSARVRLRALADVPEMPLDGLSDDVASDLLRSLVPGRVDGRAARQLLGEARGNPLALIEFARTLTTDQHPGYERLREQLPLGERLDTHFRQQVAELPDAAQSWRSSSQPTSRPTPRSCCVPRVAWVVVARLTRRFGRADDRRVSRRVDASWSAQSGTRKSLVALSGASGACSATQVNAVWDQDALEVLRDMAVGTRFLNTRMLRTGCTRRRLPPDRSGPA
jgi:hypothetical protein